MIWVVTFSMLTFVDLISCDVAAEHVARSHGITHIKTQQARIETRMDNMNIDSLNGDMDFSPETSSSSGSSSSICFSVFVKSSKSLS